jgi:hypothetical protein
MPSRRDPQGACRGSRDRRLLPRQQRFAVKHGCLINGLKCPVADCVSEQIRAAKPLARTAGRSMNTVLRVRKPQTRMLSRLSSGFRQMSQIEAILANVGPNGVPLSGATVQDVQGWDGEQVCKFAGNFADFRPERNSACCPSGMPISFETVEYCVDNRS